MNLSTALYACANIGLLRWFTQLLHNCSSSTTLLPLSLLLCILQSSKLLANSHIHLVYSSSTAWSPAVDSLLTAAATAAVHACSLLS
jgi:hypothetical protein